MLVPEEFFLLPNHSSVTLPVLAQLRQLATDSRWGMRVIECYILEALAIAAPDHSVRCFVDEDCEIDSLLLDLHQGEIETWPQSKRRFLEDITVSITAETDKINQPTINNTSPVSGLIEPLSDRECQVLALIASGSTNNVISTTLFISLNTVK